MTVTVQEIIEVLRGPFYRHFLLADFADRIEREGIAPPDGLELIADIEGIGCCTVTIRNGRVYIPAVTVRDIISMGAGKTVPPDWAVNLRNAAQALSFAQLGGHGISAQKWQDFIVAVAAAPKPEESP